MGAGASAGNMIDSDAAASIAAAEAHIERGGSLYAVAIGRQPGVYTTWGECQENTAHYRHSKWVSFNGGGALKLAKAFVEEHAATVEWGRAWEGHLYLALDAAGDTAAAAAGGGDDGGGSGSDSGAESEGEAEGEGEAGSVPRPTADECARYGLTIEGLEHFLHEHDAQIAPDATVLDVCHEIVMPHTAPPGWDDQPELVSERHRRYTHQYRPRHHPVEGWEAIRHHEKIHTAARRLRGWHHPSGLGRVAWRVARLRGQNFPPEGTHSYCEKLVNDREEAQKPLRRLLADIPHMRLKEARQALRELPLRATAHRQAEALAAATALKESLEAEVTMLKNVAAAARLTDMEEDAEAAAAEQAVKEAELDVASAKLAELLEAEKKSAEEESARQKPEDEDYFGFKSEENVHRKLREAKRAKLSTVSEDDRAPKWADTEEDRRRRYAASRQTVTAFATAGDKKPWLDDEPEPEPEPEPETESDPSATPFEVGWEPKTPEELAAEEARVAAAKEQEEKAAAERAQLEEEEAAAAQAAEDEVLWSRLRKQETCPEGLSESDQARWERERHMQLMREKEAAEEERRRERGWLKNISKLNDEEVRQMEEILEEAKDKSPMPEGLKSGQQKKWRQRRELVELKAELAYAVREEQEAEASAPDPADGVGTPNVLLCHASLYRFRDVVAAARSMVEGSKNPAINGGPRKADAPPLVFWLDCFSTDQHRMQQSCVTADGWAAAHSEIVERVGHTALVLSPTMWDAPLALPPCEANHTGARRWEMPVTLLRAWCNWELFCTARAKDCKFSVLVGQLGSSVARFEEALMDDFEAVLECFTHHVDLEMAETGAHADRDMLLQAAGEAVYRGVGGVDGVTDALVHHLHGWVTQAARGAVTARAEPIRANLATTSAVFAGWRVAGALHRLGMLPEAAELWKEVVAGYTHLEGPRSRNALAAQHALTHLLLESGESEEKVVEMLWKLLEKEIKCLGERHPDTANTRQVLGVMLRQEGEQVVAREMARPLREKKGESESAVAAEWDEAREQRKRELQELRELREAPLRATTKGWAERPHGDIEEKRRARHAERDALSKQRQRTDFNSTAALNREVGRKVAVVKRATLDAPHEVSKKNAEIEREANVHAKNFQILAQEAEDNHVAAEAAAVQRAAPHAALALLG